MCGVNAFTITNKHFGEHEEKNDNVYIYRAHLRNQKIYLGISMISFVGR